jgi:uncharacterized protein DUF2784
MLYRLCADFVVILHVGFVLFVLFGGLLALRWPQARWFHLPVVVWGAFVEFSGWMCPLTPLENRLRTQAGESGYSGDFITHHLLPFLYPDDLTREIQVILGIVVVVLNAAMYWWLWRKHLNSGLLNH